MSQGWEGLLEVLEAEIDAAPSVEPARSGEIPAFNPPADLGPVPAGLVERARSLLARMNDLQEGLERRRGELGRELSALGAAKRAATATGARPVPHFVDTTA